MCTSSPLISELEARFLLAIEKQPASLAANDEIVTTGLMRFIRG